MAQGLKASDHKESTSANKVSRMASVVLSIIHVFACVWFYIGSRYQVAALAIDPWPRLFRSDAAL